MKGSVRTVDQLDAACRGSQDINAVNAVLYHSNPKAGASIHSQLGWKSVLSRNDDLASSDPKMVEQMAHLDLMFSKSTAWAHEQKRSMEFTNDRFEHLVVVIRDEINAEHARETALLTASAHRLVPTHTHTHTHTHTLSIHPSCQYSLYHTKQHHQNNNITNILPLTTHHPLLTTDH